MRTNENRRDFLKKSALAGVGLGLTPGYMKDVNWSNDVGANDTINIGGVGCNLMQKLLLTVLVLCSFSIIVWSGEITWNTGTRTLEFSSPGSKPWLTEGKAQFRFTGGENVTTSDKRFNVAVSERENGVYLVGKDAEKIIDWEMMITSVNLWSIRIDAIIYNRSSGPLMLDRIDLITGKMTGEVDPLKNRVIVNGFNSWNHGEMVRLKPGTIAESYYTLVVQSPALAAGFLAGRHNLNRFSLIRDSSKIELKAWGECNKSVLPAGGSRSTDPLFLSGGGHPLSQMELFADLAAKENSVKLWPENFATWCSWYSGWIRQESLYEFKDGLQKGVKTNIPLIAKSLGTRGTPSMRVVDDSNEMPYGDWDNRTLAIPEGFRYLAQLMNGSGIKAGVWYPPFWVSSGSRLFMENPDLLCKNYNGQVAVGKNAGIRENQYGNHLAFLDASNPAAAEKLKTTARAWRDRGFRYVMTDFMYWGAWLQKRYDSTLTAVEAYNRALHSMRQGFGKDTYWLHCGALLGPAMGLCDGMCISGDSHGDEMYSYEGAAYRWFYNWRVWLNDPDAIVFSRYGQSKSVEFNRSWISWMALSGNVLTYGDTFDDLPPDFLDMYKRALPPLPVAGRPLDIWENEPYLIWGMDPGIADGSYTLFGVFEFQGKRPGQDIILNLDEIAARSRSWTETPKESPESWLLWDFWKKRLTKVKGPLITIPIPSKSCNVFSLRPYSGRPQLLGTSGHFSQGTLETENINWDTKTGILTGKVHGNGGDPTTLFFFVPDGMKIISSSLAYSSAVTRIIEPGVAALEIPATGEESVSFELRFECTAGKVPTRAFSGGPVAKVTIR
jgi:hypothetical protein